MTVTLAIEKPDGVRASMFAGATVYVVRIDGRDLPGMFGTALEAQNNYDDLKLTRKGGVVTRAPLNTVTKRFTGSPEERA